MNDPAKKKSRFTRKAALLLGLIVVAFIALYAARVKLPAVAKTRVETMLKDVGFSHVDVRRLNLALGGLMAKDIKLDEYGFDKIDVLTAEFNWLPFLMNGTVDHVKIDGLSIGRDSANLGPSMRQLGSNLMNIPSYGIDVVGGIIDLGTAYGEIRINTDISVSPVPETGPREINALIKSEQYQLGFNSGWKGTIERNGALDLAGTVTEGRINTGPLRISRFNGWITLASNDTTGITGQAQMEAGSAAFMDMPLEKLSLIADHGNGQDSVLFRSGLSGMKDVHLAADYTRGQGGTTFSSILKGTNLGSFLDYIEQETGHKKDLHEPLLNAEPFEFMCDYQPDRGFVGGPLPFTLTLQQSGDKKLDGNFLFYSDTLDVRGALETTPDMAVALKDYFKIPDANVKENFIRLDGTAGRFFMFGDKNRLIGDALSGGDELSVAPSQAAAPQSPMPLPVEPAVKMPAGGSNTENQP